MITGCSSTKDNGADLIVYGDIFTANEDGDTVEAIAVKDGKYVYVGNASGTDEYKDSDTEDVNATFVMPSAALYSGGSL